MFRYKVFLLIVPACVAGLLIACGGGNSSSSGGGGGNFPTLSVKTTSIPQGVVNGAYSTVLAATGGEPPYAWNLASGKLPSGVTLARDGTLAGTPTASGAFQFTVAVSDSQQPPSVANGQFDLTINAAVAIVTTSLPSDSPGVFYSNTLTATGGVYPYTWSIAQGALPDGLTLNPSTGVITGVATTPGVSDFTVQVADQENPPDTATANLAITVNPAPVRGAALYTSKGVNAQYNQIGFQIQSDGSLTMLSSSPETAINGITLAASPTLPLIFDDTSNSVAEFVDSILVNPDYSLTANTTITLPRIANGPIGVPSADPAGQNLYVPGAIDSNGTAGINVLIGNGSPQVISTLKLPQQNYITFSRMVFTPDGSLAFLDTCVLINNGQSGSGAILSFTRASDGSLTPTSTYTVPGNCYPNTVTAAMTVSPDGRYLADSEIQVFTIAADGTLTPILSTPYVFTQNGVPLNDGDIAWDASGSYLFAATFYPNRLGDMGGFAVLGFNGTSLNLVSPLDGNPSQRIQQKPPYIYAMGFTSMIYPSVPIYIYEFSNGQLTSLGNADYGNQGDMAIY